ncbi:MAG: hypothetical protein KAH46_30925, partial [Mycobacterium sp.]|nr:hypothetical protein [Mycobacterium sp.]
MAEFALPVKTLADTLIQTAPVEFLRQTQRAADNAARVPAFVARQRTLATAFDRTFAVGTDLIR